MSHHLRHYMYPHTEDGIYSVQGGNRKIFDTGELSHLDNRTVSLIQEND